MLDDAKLLYPLGRIVQHDPRSRKFALPESNLATLVNKKWTRYAPVFNQGNLGSCTGNALLGGVGTAPLHTALAMVKALPAFTQEQAIEVYSLATAIDEWPGQYPPEDTGSSGLAVAKIAKQKGWIDSYYHAFSFNAAVTALQSGPVITGVPWYSSFFYPTANGECAIKTGSNLSGGHEVVVDEIDVINQRVWFTNSWGTSWGVGGRAWWSFSTWERLLREYGDVTQLFPVIVPDEPAEPVEPAIDENDGCLARALGPWATKVITQRWQTKKNKAIAQASLDWIAKKGLSF